MRIGDDYLLSSFPPNYPSNQNQRETFQPVLTSPPVAASIWEGSRRSTRWALCKYNNHVRTFEAGLLLIVQHLVGVLEVVGGHDSLEAVVVTKHEGYSHLVYAIRYLA